MRIYLPSTLEALREAVRSGLVEPVGGIVFAVTDDLRQEYPAADDEELEFLAITDAGMACLRLLAAGPPDGPFMRVVLAGDVAEIRPTPELDRAAASVKGPVPWHQIVSVHLDGAEAAETVRQAAAVIDRADLGDDDAEFVVGSAEDVALAWYAPGEVSYLLADLP